MRGRHRTVSAARTTTINGKDKRLRFRRAVGRSLRLWVLRALIFAAMFAVCRAL